VGRPLPGRGPARAPVRGHRQESLFFPPEDIRADAERIPGAKFRETGTVWGHFTMFNLREQDTAAIDAIYADVLAE
jgi:hypothetical protein